MIPIAMVRDHLLCWSKSVPNKPARAPATSTSRVRSFSTALFIAVFVKIVASLILSRFECTPSNVRSMAYNGSELTRVAGQARSTRPPAKLQAQPTSPSVPIAASGVASCYAPWFVSLLARFTRPYIMAHPAVFLKSKPTVNSQPHL